MKQNLSILFKYRKSAEKNHRQHKKSFMISYQTKATEEHTESPD